MSVEKTVLEGRSSTDHAVSIIDVRHRPLDQLLDDAGVVQMVSKITNDMIDPSRVPVALFNSAI